MANATPAFMVVLRTGSAPANVTVPPQSSIVRPISCRHVVGAIVHVVVVADGLFSDHSAPPFVIDAMCKSLGLDPGFCFIQLRVIEVLALGGRERLAENGHARFPF